MAGDNKPGDDIPDTPSFSDEELAAAMADFEKEFGSDAADSEPADSESAGKDTAHKTGAADTTDAAADSPAVDGNTDIPDIPDVSVPDDASELDPSVGFEDELEGLVGNKAKVAVLVTSVSSAELLAAFCQISDISAECIGSQQGALAVLRNLDGDGPEAAAADLTQVVSGMPAILAVNRADKLEASLYMHGSAGQTIAPPILFSSTPRFLEDLMLGIVTLEQLRDAGTATVDSASLDQKQAMAVIARHTRMGRGGSTRGSRVE